MMMMNEGCFKVSDFGKRRKGGAGKILKGPLISFFSQQDGFLARHPNPNTLSTLNRLRTTTIVTQMGSKG